MLAKQIDEVKEKERELKRQVEKLSAGLDEKMAELSAMVQEVQKSSKETNDRISAGFAELAGKSENRNQEDEEGLGSRLDTGIRGLERKLDVCKGELSDKVHAENVKSYRNIQALVNEITERLEEKEHGSEHRKSARGLVRATLIFSIFNFLLITGWILYDLGILTKLLSLIG